jgi:hypothetical protein
MLKLNNGENERQMRGTGFFLLEWVPTDKKGEKTRMIHLETD